MKNILVLFVILIILMSPVTGFPNPGGPPPHYFNELYFENDYWIMEFFTLGFENLDGWYLTSVNDTAYFIDGIIPTEDYILITPGYGYLKAPFRINRNGDWLSLYNASNELADVLIFGEMYNAVISAPLPGQSICVELPWTWDITHYLDNSPTLGEANNDINAYGTIEGTVIDASGNPLSNLEVNYFWTTVYTDDDGHFSFFNYAVLKELQIVNNGIILDHFNIQTWPDSLITVIIDIQEPLLTAQNEIDFDYQLDQNYPNPFNPSTNIKYSVPQSSNVVIKVFDILGNEIETLVNEQKPIGTYEINWFAEDLPSGIYFYRLQAVPNGRQAGSFVETKKMVLLR